MEEEKRKLDEEKKKIEDERKKALAVRCCVAASAALRADAHGENAQDLEKQKQEVEKLKAQSAQSANQNAAQAKAEQEKDKQRVAQLEAEARVFNNSADFLIACLRACFGVHSAPSSTRRSATTRPSWRSRRPKWSASRKSSVIGARDTCSCLVLISVSCCSLPCRSAMLSLDVSHARSRLR